jgi:hypothetical protein
MIDPIIEKIKKLLRMKRGGTPGEIENALAMAAELARKHGIDLNSVNPDDESKSETITHFEEVLKLRLPLEAKFAAAILVNFFNVQICHMHGGTHREGYIKYKFNHSMIFIGTDWDIQVARYVFVFLQRHFRYSWNHRQNKRLKNREAFLHGMFLGLATKLEEAKKKEVGVGLMVLDRAVQLRNDYLAKLLPNAKDKKLESDDSDAWAAKHAGIIAGRNTEIRSGLNKADEPKRAALPPPPGQIALL